MNRGVTENEVARRDRRRRDSRRTRQFAFVALAFALTVTTLFFGPLSGANAAFPVLTPVPVESTPTPEPEPPDLGAAAIPVPAPLPLKAIPVPEPPNLDDYVRDRQEAIALGKALFWDMQVGTDGQVACATCHFHAGADGRVKNQVNPGPNGVFEAAGSEANAILEALDFPFHQRSAPAEQQESGVVRDWDDIAGSQGTRKATFVDVELRSAVEITAAPSEPDLVFQVGGERVRQVTPRNAPSVINAVYNYANLWDGSANNIFNGVNPFGAADPDARVFAQTASGLQPEIVRIPNASLASQALGPPLNAVEMSSEGRTFPKIGKKMLSLRPLGQQLVHPNDSVLGPLSRSGLPGLNTTYADMIMAAFHPKYWSNTDQIVTYTAGVPSISPRPAGDLSTDQFTQMEANFSLFFGLAIQLYESTLVADDTPFDRVMEGLQPFSPIQERGNALFFGAGGCAACHAGSEFTTIAESNVAYNTGGPPLLVERMPTGDPTLPQANYDDGFFNIGITKTTDDLGRGGTDPFGYPLSFSKLGRMKVEGTLPPDVAAYVPDLPPNTIGAPRDAVNGALKAPSLRNIELTGPYFHNGGIATLNDVIDFYTRGGNFPLDNVDDLDPAMIEIDALQGQPDADAALIAFLLMLTDERVRDEQAPFDHPQLFVPHGAVNGNPAVDELLEIPAVGAAGREAQGLEPLGSFVTTDRDPFAIEDFFSVPRNGSDIRLDVLLNDGDPDGQEITVIAVTQGENGGTVEIGPEALTVVYTPAAGFSGLDTFDYTVSDGAREATASVAVTVLPTTNRAPQAALDFFFTVPANSVDFALPVVANDLDLDGNPLWIVDVVPPAIGSVTIDPVGDQLLYSPPPGFVGFVNLTYTISDGVATSTNVATVKVNRAPVAVDDSVNVAAGSANNALWVLSNDSDQNADDVISLVAINQPAKGTAFIDPSGTYINYTPKPGLKGTDRITYVASDGFLVSFATVTITISATNAPPVAAADTFFVEPGSTNTALPVLANDSDPDGDTLRVVSVTAATHGVASVGAGGANVLYTPNPSFQGQDTFTYTVTDSKGGESTASVTVYVGYPHRVYLPYISRATDVLD